MIRIRKSIAQMQPSPTLEVTALAAQLKAQGNAVIPFAAGQPDFSTPEHVARAATEAIEAGYTGYTASAGLPELRECVARHYSRRLGTELTAANVAITVGAKHALALFLQVTLEEGDEVLIPAPYWVSYPAMVELASATPKILETDGATGYRLIPEDLSAAVGDRTRAIILNSPSNPTGAVYDPEQIEALTQQAVEHGIAILSDEIYEDLLFDGARHVSALTTPAGSLDTVAVVSGVSKTYAMTGWRIGWLISTEQVVSAVAKVIGQTTSGAPTFVQKASVQALDGDRSFLAGWVEQYRERRDTMHRLLYGIEGLTPSMPRGAFYMWVDVRDLLRRRLPSGEPLESSASLAKHLLASCHVATVPGEAFGAGGYLRISFATSMANVEAGVERIAGFVGALRSD